MGIFNSKKKNKDTNVEYEGIRRYELKSNGKYTIELEDNFISITSKGFSNFCNKGLIGTKKINLNNITGVQYKEPGVTTGYLQLVLMGSQEVKAGVMGAVRDENTILFNKKEQHLILEIKEYIESYISDKNRNKAVSTVSVADEILKFKNLLDLGAITEEEYEDKKKALLIK